MATGLIQSIGTTWGLLRHYWVLLKLLMNLFATAVLLLYMQTLDYLADQARAAPDTVVASMGDPSPIVQTIGAIWANLEVPIARAALLTARRGAPERVLRPVPATCPAATLSPS